MTTTDTVPATLGLFPGQGSQKIGMGKELFNTTELARELFNTADSVLGFSLSKLCFEGPEHDLTATAVAQPAILTVSTICFELSQRAPGKSLQLAAAAGHSLGEYSALVAAGAVDFRDAVLLVHKRGRYMQEAIPAGKGKMVAVLGMELAEIKKIIEQIAGTVEIANINTPGQIVIAGERQSVDAFCVAASGAKTIELAVSAPFHCSLMQPAAEQLARDLDALSLKPCKFPVFSNVDALPVRTPDEVRSALKRQVCGTVRWVECMQNAIKTVAPGRAIEFGAGTVLSGLLKKIDPGLKRLNIGSVSDLETL